MKKIKIGLLPLYIKLYDDLLPELRDRLDPFYEKIAALLAAEGFDVIKTPFCRVEKEFQDAVNHYENAGADCIVTLHRAYSPSLESEKALTGTSLPIVVLDTTETFAFDPMQDSAEINFNHGIHGVMDMCNILRRHAKKFAIAAGHYEQSDVIQKAAGLIRAAAAANAVHGSKVGVFGGGFQGMGDFAVTANELQKNFGATLLSADPKEMKEISASVSQAEIQAEQQADKEIFAFPEELNQENYDANTRACLTIRKWIEKHSLSAFSVNFLQVTAENGLDSMPFTEACKAMTRGIGYAGEGDALNAMLSGALLQAFPETSFVEIFCPDWKNDTLFLSHMGEMNYDLAAEKPQMRNVSFNYTDAKPPVVGYSKFKKGAAVYANIYRDETGYCLLATPVEMLEVKEDAFPCSMRGWMKPNCKVGEFLKKLSLHGATHHSLLVYGASTEELCFFGELLGMKTFEI